jgi:hypothetical protein
MMKYFGISAYAGMHPEFPVTRFMQQFPDDMKHGCIAILSGSFGWNTRIVRAFNKRFPKGLVEVHMGNGAGRRRNSHEQGEFAMYYTISSYNRALEAEDKALKKMVHQRLDKIQEKIFNLVPACKWVLSPELEDNMTDDAFGVLVGWIKSYAPDLILARSPCTGGKSLKGAKYYEKHNVVQNGQPGQILNMDGTSLDARDGSKFFQRASESSVMRMLDSSSALATMIWSARQQGYPNLSGWDKTPPKRSRTFEVSDQEISMMQRLLGGRK